MAIELLVPISNIPHPLWLRVSFPTKSNERKSKRCLEHPQEDFRSVTAAKGVLTNC